MKCPQGPASGRHHHFSFTSGPYRHLAGPDAPPAACARFMTEPPPKSGSILLHNSVNVMTRQREELGRQTPDLYPLFTHREIDRAGTVGNPCPLRQTLPFDWRTCAPARSQLKPRSSSLTPAMCLGRPEFWSRTEGRTLFYTGDVNFDDQTIAQSAIFPEKEDRHPDFGMYPRR